MRHGSREAGSLSLSLSFSLAQHDCKGGREGGREGGKGGMLPGCPRSPPEGSRTSSSPWLDRGRGRRSVIAEARPGPRQSLWRPREGGGGEQGREGGREGKVRRR